MNFWLVLFCFGFLLYIIKCNKLFEIYKWKQMDYERQIGLADFAFPGHVEARLRPKFDFIQYNNIPMGVSHYYGRLIITMPRRRPGIPSTLNFIDMRSQKTQSPKLIPFPNLAQNELQPQLRPDNDRLVSVYRTRIDICNRLWFVDTGTLEYPNNITQIQRPSIWIIDLRTNRRVKRFEIPSSIVEQGYGMPSITVDVEPSDCNNVFAYIPDLLNNRIHVYSYAENRMWSFTHNYFSFEPMHGDLTIAGLSFRWNDGIFSITLGNKQRRGFRSAYFHPMCSTSEFVVSTRTLKNESATENSNDSYEFQHLGIRGMKTQSNMHGFDTFTGVIFFTEIARSGIGCWNTNKPLSEKNYQTIQNNHNTMIYPSDLTIDNSGRVWIMTNSMPVFIYSNLSVDEYNFRIWSANGKDLIKGTVCDL